MKEPPSTSLIQDEQWLRHRLGMLRKKREEAENQFVQAKADLAVAKHLEKSAEMDLRTAGFDPNKPPEPPEPHKPKKRERASR